MTEAQGKVIMVQGTTSHAGKSVLATALCRIFAQDGYSVAPFKAQNMALNSYVTPDGGEIGRSQAVQAEAAGVAPSVEMNPVLLKPEAEMRSQVVVMGKVTEAMSAREYYKMKTTLWPIVTDALDRLRAQYDIVVIEGAGSPAEINLKAHEIVNMRVAKYADAPVVLVGDIDRGGVFASFVGTMILLEPEERELVKAFIINKFRGDPTLLDSGLDMLHERTGVPIAGVVTYFKDIFIPEEDSLGLIDTLQADKVAALIDVAVVKLPHIANFDDIDPLHREPELNVRYVASAAELKGAELVVIPGSKTTIDDLKWIRECGIDRAIISLHEDGVPVVGICGGFQMIGQRILDPEHIESQSSEIDGLGLLPVTTSFEGTKTTHQVKARSLVGSGILSGCAGAELTGYEIHMGQTRTNGSGVPFRITERSGKGVDSPDGAIDPEGITLGTYMHGLFHNDSLRRSIINWIAERKGVSLAESANPLDINAEFDKLADHVRRELDMKMLYGFTGLT